MTLVTLKGCAWAAELAQRSLSLGQGLLVHLYLADMGHFSAANAAYARHFGSSSPPARACVQALLPAGTTVAVDVLLPRPGACGACRPRPVLTALVVRDSSYVGNGAQSCGCAEKQSLSMGDWR